MRTIRDLNLCDDFLFREVMKDEKPVTQLLERILDLKGKIRKIVYLQEEKTIGGGYFSKGVRLDVYVQDEALDIYEVEMQQSPSRVLPKRCRKYQTSMDQIALKKGQSYDKLGKQYIIFICTFDPYDKGLWKYTFSNLCHENPCLELGDQTMKIFLNTRGTCGNVSPELKAFLRFVEHSTMQQAELLNDDYLRELATRIETIKSDEEIGGVFMTFEERLQEQLQELADEKDREYEKLLQEKEKALQEQQSDAARKMKEDGFSSELIAKYINLMPEEIEKL